MRPLPDLRQVRHHRRVRPTATSPAGGRAATRPGRRRARLGPRGRTPHRHRPPPHRPAHRPRRDHRPRHPRDRTTTLHVYRLSEPIDDFDGLTPLNEWLDGDAERLAWALRAVLALAQAAPTVGWRGRHAAPADRRPPPDQPLRHPLPGRQAGQQRRHVPDLRGRPADCSTTPPPTKSPPAPSAPGHPPNARDLRLDEPEPDTMSPQTSTRPNPPSDQRRSS